jgi:hypothetical protein
MREIAQTHYFVGGQVRKVIEAIHRPFSEIYPFAPSVRKMAEKRQRKTAKKKTQGRRAGLASIGQDSFSR